MLALPTSSGETVTGEFKEYFMPYAKIQVGDYLQYNPIMDKMVVVPISDRPNYTIIHISKCGILKKRIEVTIEKLGI